MVENRKMTHSIRSKYDFYLEMKAYAESIQTRFFASKKEIANAFLAKDKALHAFWEKVADIWPDLSTHVLEIRMDYSINIHYEEKGIAKKSK